MMESVTGMDCFVALLLVLIAGISRVTTSFIGGLVVFLSSS